MSLYFLYIRPHTNSNFLEAKCVVYASHLSFTLRENNNNNNCVFQELISLPSIIRATRINAHIFCTFVGVFVLHCAFPLRSNWADVYRQEVLVALQITGDI